MRKKFTSKINNSQQAEESKHCNFRIYCQFHRPQRYKFPRRLRWIRRRRATMTLSCNIQINDENTSAKKSKYYINNGRFRHHNNCGSTHPSMPTSMPPSFSGFKSQTFLHESCYESASYDGVSGTDNDEQLLNNSASVFHLWLLEAFSWFQNSSILPTQSSHNRGWI